MILSTPLPRVLLTDPIDACEAARLGDHAEVVTFDEGGPVSFEHEIAGASFVVVRRAIPAAALERATHLRALVRHGAGLDFIPVEAATRLGIAVTNTPSVNARSVAEHVFGLVISLARRIAENDAGIRSGKWQTLRAAAPRSAEISGKTLGLVGFGGIGQAIAQIAKHGFGMNVLAATRRPREDENGILFRPLVEVAAKADILVVACPLSEHTHNLVCEEIISAMPPNAILVNVARGPIIDEAAVAAALHSGQLGGAALDVFANQPLPADSPLRSAPNALLSPHVAGVTAEAMARMSRTAVDDILKMILGDEPRHLVNRKAWPLIAKRWDQLERYDRAPDSRQS
ncbi:MAG: NAD(P)-dependent oxidoreductase [Aurantimonas coralicida]|uniref:NAD(P)-dependent oxidoreductase n=1 Tax=Aurantimonas TaxID=182269 RepID=UPI0004145CEF|nr:NAD(P)-dependent oxidoreductase [Aurantimonas coralicida]